MSKAQRKRKMIKELGSLEELLSPIADKVIPMELNNWTQEKIDGLNPNDIIELSIPSYYFDDETVLIDFINIFELFAKNFDKIKSSKVVLSVMGYDDDKRELIEIPAVLKWTSELPLPKGRGFSAS